MEKFFEIIQIIGTFSSILSLLISIFLVSKIVKIEKNIKIKGNENIIAGENAYVKK